MIETYVYVKDRIQGKAPRGARRSSKWRKVRAAWLEKNPRCAACGERTNLEVHHIKPFHTHPELELDTRNLVTLCESGKFGIKSCHRFIGHRGNWRLINPYVMFHIRNIQKILLGRE